MNPDLAPTHRSNRFRLVFIVALFRFIRNLVIFNLFGIRLFHRFGRQLGLKRWWLRQILRHGRQVSHCRRFFGDSGAFHRWAEAAH